MLITEERAKDIALWWSSFLKMENGAPLDNGDKSITGAMYTAISRESQKKHDIKDVSRFTSQLKKLLSKEQPNYINVDYHPCDLLQRAAENANFNLGTADLPWKTEMVINPDNIMVKVGYGKPFLELITFQGP